MPVAYSCCGNVVAAHFRNMYYLGCSTNGGGGVKLMNTFFKSFDFKARFKALVGVLINSYCASCPENKKRSEY